MINYECFAVDNIFEVDDEDDDVHVDILSHLVSFFLPSHLFSFFPEIDRTFQGELGDYIQLSPVPGDKIYKSSLSLLSCRP